jgi:hypothetical protein
MSDRQHASLGAGIEFDFFACKDDGSMILLPPHILSNAARHYITAKSIILKPSSPTHHHQSPINP